MSFFKLTKTVWFYLVLPKSTNKDRARREFILNILLLGLIFLVIIALVITFIAPLFYQGSSTIENPIIPIIILFFLGILFYLSHSGKSYIAAGLFISLLLFLVGFTLYRFGADLGEGLLLSALLVVISGILLGSRSSLIITVLNGFIILFFTYLEINNLYHPNKTWRLEPIRITDSIVYIITLAVITSVSWLFNSEREKALKRVRQSERALKKQRDRLEVTVERRTQQLKLAQVEKLEQMSRFAEIGQIATGLFHDLANPLNLISLNLEKMSKKSPQLLQDDQLTDTEMSLKRAIYGTKVIENFLLAARKQIQNQEVRKYFSIPNEIEQVIQILDYRIRANQIKIEFIYTANTQILGNPIKFSQMVSNILSNAIDSYDSTKKKKRLIKISLEKKDNTAVLSFEDWGKGIYKQHLTKIFEPLYTTKNAELGMGVGLSLTKKIINKDFCGTIHVSSVWRKGSTFTIVLPLHKPRIPLYRPQKNDKLSTKS